ncbi:phosphinothricin acetyltransferase [Natronorubrum sediminis]|uniref:Phosphinothricin acetyltransferase n=1 Tax=Natronorubrum sediminis TaxID=640943 RepID=A0A1H6G1Y6_9EURY|nr:GNAT family N-acetyltransferase [Natronorubrum sediminis]SEH17087.1 phosphinothricin acetyltransferase [Natronorubrum sediminis]
MNADPRIRIARPADANDVRDIYAPFCESSPVTFEETPPTEAEMAERIESTLETYPWLVCELEEDVVGYAYASRLRKRRAYQWTVELSVYVDESTRRTGVGRALYESLFAVLERQGVCDAYAVTTVPNPETERFHERLDFDRVVDFPAMGYIEDEWYDVAWWRRQLTEKADEPTPIRPFSSVRESDDGRSLVRAGERVLEEDAHASE